MYFVYTLETCNGGGLSPAHSGEWCVNVSCFDWYSLFHMTDTEAAVERRSSRRHVHPLFYSMECLFN